MMEELVKILGAVLKTLECPICLELLKTPVSAGCGHFFCRECVSGLLLSSYRAPCPLCKRSFTRRSVQEAHQRQTVILAAQTLGRTCSNLLGTNSIVAENASGENEMSFDVLLPAAKKLKTILKENKDGMSKKRKSVENEDTINHGGETDFSVTGEKVVEGTENTFGISSDGCSSAKKRLCHNSDDEKDSEDLPSLEDLLSSQQSPLHDVSTVPAIKGISFEKPLLVIPSVKETYLHCNRKIEIKPRPPQTDISGAFNSEGTNKVLPSRIDDNCTLSNNENDREPDHSLSVGEHKCANVRNKINALKNKTNEVRSDERLLQDDFSLTKAKSHKTSKNDQLIKPGLEIESKENELSSNPITSVSHSVLKNSNVKKVGKKLTKNNQVAEQDSDTDAVPSESNDDARNLNIDNVVYKVVPEKTSISYKENEYYNLNEISISACKSNEDTAKKSIDDPLGLTDTAVSVKSVTSPLTAKALLLHKSPGWSRVKKVKKDFKVKKFSTLHIEKNSPPVLLKCAGLSLDSAAPESTSLVINKSDQSGVGNKTSDLDCSNDFHSSLIDMQNVQPVNDVSKKYQKEFNSSSESKWKTLSDCNKADDDSSQTAVNKQFSDPIDPVNINRQGNLDKLEIQKDMDYSSTNLSVNCMTNMNNNNKNEQKTSTENLSPEKKSGIIIGGNCALPSVDNKRLDSKSVIYDENSDVSRISSTFYQNVEDPRQSVDNRVVVDTSLYEKTESGNRKETMTSKQAFVVFDNSSEQNKDKLCSNDITPKRNKSSLTLKTRISEYQSFQTQSLLNEESVEYVEHSQQTSQIAHNFDNHNLLYNNKFALLAHQQHLPQQPPLPTINSSAGKAKVVKRMCLTLDEIQEYFYKSSQFNSAEKICSVPFLAGQFKLDVSVSEETLNVSILKIIDPSVENNGVLCTLPMLSDKGIQSSSNILNIPSPTVLPSSNSSDPNYSVDPYPYLNKLSNPTIIFKPPSVAMDEEVCVSESPIKAKEVLKIPEIYDDLNEKSTSEVLEMSEIVHFPEKTATGNSYTFQRCSNMSFEYNNNSNTHANDDITVATEQYLQEQNDGHMELDMSVQSAKEIPEDSSKLNEFPKLLDDDSEDSCNSEKEASLKKLQQCASKASTTKGKTQSRLSLKKNSKLKKSSDSNDESDSENDEKVSEDRDASPVSGKHTSTSDRKFHVFKEPSSTRNLKNNTNSPVATELEMPCTLNSMVSEITPEANASEIIQEIEDLSDEIKLLEAKLKQCGHKNMQINKKSKHKSLKELCKQKSPEKNSIASPSGSEDSDDLFPQSVPPTPPEPSGNEGNSSYRSFYKLV